MASKPITYDCVESILKHTNLNTRLELKARCPSIRQLEITIPLEIDVLDFSGPHVIVNGVEYHIGVVQKWSTDGIPDWAKLDRMEGPQQDVDEFGRRSGASHGILMPGDIDLTGKGRIPWGRQKNPFEHIKGLPVNPDNLNKEIEEVQNRIKEKKKKSSMISRTWDQSQFNLISMETTNVFISKEELKFITERIVVIKEDVIIPGEEETTPGPEETQREAVNRQKELDLEIFKSQKDLQRLFNIRDNVIPEFQVQLTIRSESAEKQIKYGKYTGKLHESQKGLMNFILGNRNAPIKVKKLIVSHESVIRAPIGLKLEVEGLKIIGRKYHLPRLEEILNRLRPIFDESSIPLKSIEFRSKRVEEFNHEMIMSAKEVIIKWKHNPLTMINACVDLPHQRVTADVCYTTPYHYIDFVKLLKDSGRPIGTHRSFIINDGPPEEIFKVFQKDAISKGDKFVVIPFNEEANLKVSCHSYDQISFEVIGLSE
uniref:FTH domain-containing protein n=1 Tax=Caenorhabditis tropicalis TaxID=1561998 RepID=A0A1I7TAG2_9PELO